jgi:hypothetical protein
VLDLGVRDTLHCPIRCSNGQRLGLRQPPQSPLAVLAGAFHGTTDSGLVEPCALLRHRDCGTFRTRPSSYAFHHDPIYHPAIFRPPRLTCVIDLTSLSEASGYGVTSTAESSQLRIVSTCALNPSARSILPALRRSASTSQPPTMSDLFIGLTMLVTLSYPPGHQLRGKVSSVVAGKSLTLRNGKPSKTSSFLYPLTSALP